MQDKKNFGKYLLEKRKQANLTQEELAKKLYVLSTTISKWERGVTYPDITLIPKLCKELNISEHEFFTSCDDLEKEREKKELNKYQNIIHIFQKLLTISYILGILVSILVDFCINHQLTWSFIVLPSIFISWTLTNFPFLIKKNKYRGIKTSLVLTIGIIILLWIINAVVNGNWFLKSLWIASFVFFFFWLDIFICTFSKITNLKKISITLFIIALVTLITNPLSQKILEIYEEESNLPNLLSAIIMLLFSLFFWFYKGKRT